MVYKQRKARPMHQQIQRGREGEMGDSSDSVSVDMEGISFAGKVPTFLSYYPHSVHLFFMRAMLCLVAERMLEEWKENLGF